MKKKSNGDLKKDEALAAAPFTREQLRRGVMGKYFRQASTGRRTITLASDVAKVFRNDSEVNEALRLVQKMRELGRTGQRKSA